MRLCKVVTVLQVLLCFIYAPNDDRDEANEENIYYESVQVG